MINLCFAAEINEENKIKVLEKSDRLIYCYLPTKANYNLPFLINSNFVLDAGRTDIHEDNFLNKIIIEKIFPFYLLEWISEIACNQNYKKYILNLIPNKITLPEVYRKNFDNNLKKAINSTKFIPNHNDKILYLKNSFIDDIKLFPLDYKFLQKSFFLNLSNMHNTELTKDSLIMEEIEKERETENSISIYDLGIAQIQFDSILKYFE